MELLSRSEPYIPKKNWWMRMKIFFKSQLLKFPLFGNLALRLWRYGRSRFFVFKWSFCRTKIEGIDINEVYWVSPAKIKYCTLKEFDIYDFKGKIIGGDWDRLEKKFKDLDIFAALKYVVLDGGKWEDTDFYKRILKRLSNGDIIWDCKNKVDFDRRCEFIENLYRKIKEEGYKAQDELLRFNQESDSFRLDDEITVSIGSYGDLMFSGNGHRLVIAKLLNMKSIPVKIAVRHPEWVRFRNELLTFSNELGGRLHQPVLHPDLASIPANDCKNIYEIIRKVLSVDKGTLLDLGADLGYFCHKFEDDGFQCYAAEESDKSSYFLRKIRRAENKKFIIIEGSIFENKQIRNNYFNTILALNAFPRILETRRSYIRFIRLLMDLHSDELYFMSASISNRQEYKIYKSFTIEELVNFILKNSKFRHVKMIGELKDKSQIYKFY